jgi:zinc-ribbon domain
MSSPSTTQKAENKCPKCETVNLPDAVVCTNCGAELPKMPPSPGVSATGASPKVPPTIGAPGFMALPKAPPASPKKQGE